LLLRLRMLSLGSEVLKVGFQTCWCAEMANSSIEKASATLPEELVLDEHREALWSFDLEDPFWTLQWSNETFLTDDLGLLVQ
jgi:hypothetical protein